MFRGDFQVAADMVFDQFPDVFGRFHRQIVAQAGGDKDFLDAGQGARTAVQLINDV